METTTYFRGKQFAFARYFATRDPHEDGKANDLISYRWTRFRKLCACRVAYNFEWAMSS